MTYQILPNVCSAHCCTCSGVCHHIGGPWYCYEHRLEGWWQSWTTTTPVVTTNTANEVEDLKNEIKRLHGVIADAERVRDRAIGKRNKARKRADKAEKELRRLRSAIDSGWKVGPGDPDDCPGNNGSSCCGYPDICKANW